MIDPLEVRRIAKLARLEIDESEAEGLARDLERIVGYVDQLREVDLPADAESLTYFGCDVLREDRVASGLCHDDALRNAPCDDGEFFLVPKILDKEEG